MVIRVRKFLSCISITRKIK